MGPIKKVLVANRGEIAVRVMRTLKSMGIRTVAVYSEADVGSLHVLLADESCMIGPAAASESYLVIEKIIHAARTSGADAVHPGYGFLSENASFARACAEAGLIFIGPRPETIEKLGNKLEARALAVLADVPTVPGSGGPVANAAQALERATEIGFPILLKAAAGGGGKGMRSVRCAADLSEAFDRATSEARSAFGDASVYVERLVEEPHHIEVQIFADSHGNVVHLGERECSIQRRHQKLVEESPSPTIDAALRSKLGESAIRIARASQYLGAGTVEFLVDGSGNSYFLEVNTRLQVEHPVTELVTGLDLVRWQIEVAQGKELPLAQDQIIHRGAAIEVRLYAEDPTHGFLPSPGKIHRLERLPAPGVREDTGVVEDARVTPDYDPLVSKIIAWGEDRPQAIARLKGYLMDSTTLGIRTTAGFFLDLLDHPEFRAGRMTTAFLEDFPEVLAGAITQEQRDLAAVAAALIATYRAQNRRVQMGASTRGWQNSGRRQATSRSTLLRG